MNFFVLAACGLLVNAVQHCDENRTKNYIGDIEDKFEQWKNEEQDEEEISDAEFEKFV